MPPFEAFVAATEPDDVETILLDTRTRFEEGAASAILEPLVGRASLILSSGPQHMRQRKTLLPAFHGSLAERWEQPIAEITERHLSRLPLETAIALREPVREIALDAICRILFGADDPAEYAELRDDVARGLDPRIVVLLWFPTLWRRHGRLNPARPHQRRRQYIHDLVHAQIARRRADPTHAERDDVLSVLVSARDEDGQPLGDGEVRDLLLGLLMAGHETTANSLTWAFERLSRTPHARARLAQELADGGGEYLDAVVSETLRTRPSVIDAVRTATSEIELGGYPIAPGTVVSAMPGDAPAARPVAQPARVGPSASSATGRGRTPTSRSAAHPPLHRRVAVALEMRTVLRTALGMLDVVCRRRNSEQRMRLNRHHARAVARGTRGAAAARMDIKLKHIAIPVTDIDRAKAFYVEQAGFNADHDHTVSDEIRFVQLTPPGSACSIAFGQGITDAGRPARSPGLQIVVDDIEAARGSWPAAARGQRGAGLPVAGSFLQDPDGNGWACSRPPLRAAGDLTRRQGCAPPARRRSSHCRRRRRRPGRPAASARPTAARRARRRPILRRQRDADHRQLGVRGDDPRQRRREAGTGDDHLSPRSSRSSRSRRPCPGRGGPT